VFWSSEGTSKEHPKGTPKAPQSHHRSTHEAAEKHARSIQEAHQRHPRSTQEAANKAPQKVYIGGAKDALFHLFFNTFCSLAVPNKPLKTFENHTRSNPEDLNRQRSGRAPVDVKSKTKHGIRKCIFLHFPMGK
jgi:hypothetical protein